MSTLVALERKAARQLHQKFGTVTDKANAYQRSKYNHEALNMFLPLTGFHLLQQNKRFEINFGKTETGHVKI